MRRAVELLWSFVDDDGAATAVEYGLIASVISIAAVMVLIQIGVTLQAIYVKTGGLL